MTKKLPVILFGAAASALWLAAAGAAGQTPATTGDHDHGAMTKSASKPAASSPDAKFAMEAAKGGMMEVEMGRMAAEKATNADVKQFGQKMVDDHSKANDELKSVAEKKGVTLPSAVDAASKAKMDKMSKMTGDAFDRAYMADMLKDHQKDVAAFRKESKSGKDADIQGFATKTLPTLEEHLKMAQDINAKVSGKAKAKPAAAASH